jgi:hypothetical protein
MGVLDELIGAEAPREFGIPYRFPDGRLLRLTFRRSDDYQVVIQLDRKADDRWEKAKAKAEAGQLTPDLAAVFPQERGLYLIAAKMGLTLKSATLDGEAIDPITITGFLTLARRKGHFFRILADQWAMGQAGAYNGEMAAQAEAKKNSSTTPPESESSESAEPSEKLPETGATPSGNGPEN